MSASLLESVAATTTHRDREELDRAVARLLLQFLVLRKITLLRLLDDGNHKRVQIRVQISGQEGELQQPVTAVPIETLPLVSEFAAWQESVRSGAIVKEIGAEGVHATIFPIQSEREISGLLVLDSTEALGEREVNLVQGILAILKNHLALLDYGELDALTGLLNRKTFETYFDKLRRRIHGPQTGGDSGGETCAPRSEQSWLALIDIDHFKSINDSYGHLFGDEVLLLVSQLMKRCFRGADSLFRFGGEEFVVTLECTDEAGARIAFERLRAAIAEHAFPQVNRVTVSVGYTQIQAQDVPALCVERADAALYYAKEHGRNNVQNCEDLISNGLISVKVERGEIEFF